MARHGLLDEFEGDEPASDTGLLLRQEGLASDEFAFLKADSPVCIGFKRRRVFAHVVAIQQIPHFQPEKIPCAEPRRLESPCLSLVDEQIPEAADLVCVDVYFITQFTGVTGPGQQAGQATDRGVTAVMELEAFKQPSRQDS